MVLRDFLPLVDFKTRSPSYYLLDFLRFFFATRPITNKAKQTEQQCGDLQNLNNRISTAECPTATTVQAVRRSAPYCRHFPRCNCRNYYRGTSHFPVHEYRHQNCPNWE